MKDEIKQFIEENNLLYPTFNRNIARRKYWENRNKEWAEYLFQHFDRCRSQTYISFADYLRFFLFDEGILRYYTDVHDFLTNCKGVQYRPGTSLYNDFYDKACELINFTPVSMTEIIYCYRNGITDRPVCKECGKEVKFNGFTYGYRTFCSQKCQMTFNNKIKDIKKSDKTDDEIREIISKVPLDLRNLTNIRIADHYQNILDYTSEFSGIHNKERIHIFMHELTYDDTRCKHCGEPLLFRSQGTGYTKTCRRKLCMGIEKNSDYYNDEDENVRVLKGGSSYASGFLYVFYSPSLNFYKIGISQNPVVRLAALRKVISDYEIFDCFWLKDQLYNTEQRLHSLFIESKVYVDTTFEGYTEIFNLTDADLKFIREFIHEAK